MGAAHRKAERGAKLVTVDFTAPQLSFNSTVTKAEPDLARLVAAQTRFALSAILVDAFPQGAKLHDRKYIARWQETINEETPAVEMRYDDVEWLLGILRREDLALSPNIAQYSIAILDWLEALTPSAEPPSGSMETA